MVYVLWNPLTKMYWNQGAEPHWVEDLEHSQIYTYKKAHELRTSMITGQTLIMMTQEEAMIFEVMKS